MINHRRQTNDKIQVLRRRIGVLNAVFAVGFLIIGVGLIYWIAFRAPEILAREDNPRLVDSEAAVLRGKIVSTNGAVLVETIESGGIPNRRYETESSGPVVGYYSLRHGTAGIESTLDSVLRGESGDAWSDFFNYRLLGYEQIGRDVRLTLDERWQRAAERLLGEQNGAVILLSLPDGKIRALSSHPSYNPNLLDEQFEELLQDENAPLLNRVIQGQYEPGMTIQPFILAQALEQRLIDLDEAAANDKNSEQSKESTATCQELELVDGAWAEILKNACSGPMVEIGRLLGEDGIKEALNAFKFTEAPEIALETPRIQQNELVITDPGSAAIGTDSFTVNPLQLALGLAALANDGAIKDAQIIEAVQAADGGWQTVEKPQEEYAVSSLTASAIRSLMPVNRGISEHSVTVESEQDGKVNSWYLALAPASKPLFALVVVIEDSSDRTLVEQIGRSLIHNIFTTAAN